MPYKYDDYKSSLYNELIFLILKYISYLGYKTFKARSCRWYEDINEASQEKTKFRNVTNLRRNDFEGNCSSNCVIFKDFERFCDVLTKLFISDTNFIKFVGSGSC